VPTRVKQIALFLPLSPGYFSDVVAGVQEFASRDGVWSTEVCSTAKDAEATLKSWRPDGILLNAIDNQWSQLLASCDVPIVQVGGEPMQGVPRVMTDNTAIGTLAADHLVERCFTNLAFVGYKRFEWAMQRRDAFRQRALDLGKNYLEFCAEFEQLHTARVADTLAGWVTSLPKPCAVFACHDRVAMLIGHACTVAGVDVPKELAILGVDNSLLECGFTRPTLSSIMGSARRIGYEASALLSQLMSGTAVSMVPKRIAPAGVAVRPSTDVFASDDPDVRAALAYIDSHLGDPFSVAEMARDLMCTRRMLERKFADVLCCSPADQILRSRIARAKTLLIETTLPILVIAGECGFPSGSKFCAVFKRETDITPLSFRKYYGNPRTVSGTTRIAGRETPK
jgi:LacI family transcriptional regulator